MAQHETSSPEPVQAVDRAFTIVETLRELGGAGVTELAEELGVPKSTVFNQLKTLRSRGYVVKEGGEYNLGLRLLGHGEFVREKKPEFGMAESKVEMIAEETNERAHFVVEERNHAIHVHTKTGAHAVQNGTDAGTRRIDLHSVAAGKSILAHLPDSDVDTILAANDLEAYTENTITDREMLDEELATVRDRGYAQNDEESMLGLRAVAAPILYPDGELLGVLSVSGPTNRLKGDRFDHGLPDLLRGYSNEIEVNVTHRRQSG